MRVLLPEPGRTDNGYEFAFTYSEVDVAQGEGGLGSVGEDHTDVLEFDYVHC